MNPSLSTLVGAEIRAELARRRMAQDVFAKGIKVSQATLSRRLSGASPFTLDELEAASKYLNVPVAQLLGRAAPVAVPA